MYNGILLVGPTGSGKTPLGNVLGDHELSARRCCHFDFGANLRLVADGRGDGFTRQEITFIQDMLEKGTLLEAESFYLANKILRSFIARNGLTPDDWIILNGLPRHVHQANAIAEMLTVRAVIELACSAETVVARILQNTGGDRAGRQDDRLDLVRQKLVTYEERTAPLLNYYQARGVAIVRLRIDESSRVADLARKVAESLHGLG